MFELWCYTRGEQQNASGRKYRTRYSGWTISTAIQSIKSGETVFNLASISQDLCVLSTSKKFTLRHQPTYQTGLKITFFRQLVVQPARSATFSVIGSV